MNLNKLVLPILGATALIGCGSDSESTDPSVQVRTVSVNTVLANISEVNALSQDCLMDFVPEKEITIPELMNVCALQDTNGNVHYVRTNDYELTVTDMFGTQTYTIDDIVYDASLSVDIFGEATFKITAKVDDSVGHQFYSYYLVEGETDISSNESEVTIEVDNKDYSYVTFSVADHDDIDFEHTTITELNSEAKNFGATGSEGGEQVDSAYAYRYINRNADIIFTISNGLTAEASIDDFQPGVHYDFGELAIDPSLGNIIIKDPDFGTPIDISPTPTPITPVISESQMDNAEFMRFNEHGHAKFKTTTNIKGKAEPWLYPDVKFEDGAKLLNQFNFSYAIDDNGNDFSTFMNIYLLNGDGESVRADYFADDNIKVEGVKLSKEQFINQYGEYKLAARADGIKFKTNFIVRIADDNTKADLEFTVTEYTVEELQPTVTQ